MGEASDMDDLPRGLRGWSWEENKLFELALAVVDEQHPDRWEVVAAMVGGEKSAGDVQEHYVILLEDLQVIESGKLDHKLGEAQPCVLVDCTGSSCFSDKDVLYHNPAHNHYGILQRTLVENASSQTLVRIMLENLAMNYPTQTGSELLIEVWNELHIMKAH